MTIKLPQQKKWPQINQGNLLGHLSTTRNIDLNTPGLIKLAQRTRYVGQTSSGSFVDVHAITWYNQYYWIASNAMFKMNIGLADFAADVLANTPSTPINDLTVWDNCLYASKTSRISKLSNETWTQDWSMSAFTNTTSGFPHPVEPNVTNANLLVGDGNVLKKVIADGTVSTAITFPSHYNITWIRRGVNVNYIGLAPLNQVVSNGAVAIWDGLATTLGANQIINLNCRQAHSGVMDDNGIFNIFTSDGRLMRFNGSGFSYVAELPVFRDFLARRGWGQGAFIGAKVFQRGMQIVRGKIHVVVEAQTTTQIMQPEFQGGCWVYDDENNAFYLKYAPSNSNTITDFGQSIFGVGPSALCPVFENTQNEIGPADAVGGTLIFGGRLISNTLAGTYLRTLVSVTTGLNRGQFSIVKIESPGIADNNIALWCKYFGVDDANSKIVFKYRTSKKDPYVITNSGATWTSTTVFTSTDTKLANAEAGEEITVLTGNGAGSTAHISTITLNGSTYTVTLDEAITGISANDTAWIMFDNWKKFGDEITSADTLGYKRIPIPDIGTKTWIEIKGELRGEGGEVGIEELQLVNKLHQPTI